jgi:oligoribonuclease (3'-5' exoribonuclease)
MNKDIDSRVKQAAKILEVDKPIMSHRVVGSRIELHLLGGSVAVLDSHPFYRDMGVSELKQLARRHKIRGRSKMNRDQLIQALEEIDQC